ncbi:MAG TPA: zinc-ribbon domain containing protein [Candidatus Gastranaerophilales bacterium]|nr:zinc-ribbon domain containing protein [Candidatus Gastranaerophilales bacterium]
MYNQESQDQQVQCAECSQTFVFSAEDQDFYRQKGYSTPKRCPVCRANRKANGSRNDGRSRSGGGNKPQYRINCSACGREATVPFEPRGDRPVYCSDCYRNG